MASWRPPTRIPLQDLSVEQFTAPSADTRKHKRPLSPSRSSALPTSSTVYGSHFATPSRSSRKLDTHAPLTLPSSSGSTKTCMNTRMPHLWPDEANTIPLPSPGSLDPCTPPTIHLHHATRNVDRQSKHYPGFEIHHDGPSGVVSPISAGPLQNDGRGVEVNVDSEEGIKENVPPKRKTKKICSKGFSSATSIDPTNSCPRIFSRKNDPSCPADVPSPCLTRR
ncbi:hypothetical protein F5141DRAFT_1126546 [Pisolithus sp. B1]|nr:hypothetical protein F5141DRAFT_1126546 [Pisolithus sp. B1]